MNEFDDQQSAPRKKWTIPSPVDFIIPEMQINV